MNDEIAAVLDEVARILSDQGANQFRVRAYLRAADTLRGLARPAAKIFASEGIAGLESLPGIGASIAQSIRNILVHGRLAMLERLRGESDPVALLMTVPGIGTVLAHRLHDDLGIETLEQLEAAAHDGRLDELVGRAGKRLAGIRDWLSHRLQRVRPPRAEPASPAGEAPVAELLDVDREYREKAATGKLRKITPRRFNPEGEAWLPVLHTRRGPRHYTALFSNSARAHELGKTNDWVVLYHDGDREERQCTVITSEFGPLRGRRIVRGRETECAAHYRQPHISEFPPREQELGIDD